MTQHTQNNRSINNPNATNASHLHKVRGTQTRVSRVKVATLGKAPFPEKQHRSCPRCKESTNSMRILNERVEKIEELVEALAKTTRGLASKSKREDRYPQSTLRFKGIDLTRCTLQELQRLVVTTTNLVTPSNTNDSKTKKSTQNPSTNSVKDTTLSDITTTTNNEKKIVYSEPISMEDIKIIPNADSRDPFKASSQQPNIPIKTVVSSLKHVPPRHDSGFDEIIEYSIQSAQEDQKPSKKSIRPSVD